MKAVIPTLSTAKGRDLATRLSAVIRRIAGMPNYEAYLEHLRTHHPGCPLPTEREYYDEYLKGKYGGTISRCC